MWDTFWRVVFFILIVAVLTTCVSCSGDGKKKPVPTMDPERLEQLIKAARKAGCVVKGINIDAYMETVQIVCQSK